MDKTYLYTTSYLNCREKPSLDAPVITVLKKGSRVEIRGEIRKDFYPVICANTKGWAHKSWLISSPPAEPVTPPPVITPVPPTTNDRGQKIAAESLKYEGYRYVWGTRGPNTFDCSGLVFWVYQQAINEYITPGSYAQFNLGVSIPKDKLQPGDLLFYNTLGDGPGHVGIYVSPGLMMNALNESTGVVKSNPFSPYFAPLYLGARRV